MDSKKPKELEGGEDTVIVGIQIEMASEKLRLHLKERAEYHKGKTDWYAGQIKNLKKGGMDETIASNDPVRSLQQSMNDHAGRYTYFQLLADNVIPKVKYRLSQHDLSAVEFTMKTYY